MVELTRTVRLNVSPHAPRAPHAPGPSGVNGFGGRPAMITLGAHYEFDVVCRGRADPDTGYLVDIGVIDRALAAAALPLLAEAFRAQRPPELGALLRDIASAAAAQIPASIARVTWRLTPTFSLTLEPDTVTTDAPARILLRQSFEFAASHRLHTTALSDDENRAVFGKCNNPSGHGHNYQIEACVETPLTADGAPAYTLADLEAAVDETVIRRFDHKHLNLDTQEFSALNPSVEHIARVCFELLRPRIDNHAQGVRLRDVRVWETGKTSATYPA